jgi:CRISPR system Cascade subunit CasC
VLAEAGSRQPRSLANAFRDAVKPPSVAAATAALGSHLAALDAMYGAREARFVSALNAALALPGTPSPVPIDTLARAIAAEATGV